MEILKIAPMCVVSILCAAEPPGDTIHIEIKKHDAANSKIVFNVVIGMGDADALEYSVCHTKILESHLD